MQLPEQRLVFQLHLAKPLVGGPRQETPLDSDIDDLAGAGRRPHGALVDPAGQLLEAEDDRLGRERDRRLAGDERPIRVHGDAGNT